MNRRMLACALLLALPAACCNRKAGAPGTRPAPQAGASGLQLPAPGKFLIVEYMTETCPWCHKLKGELDALNNELAGALNIEYVLLDKQRQRLEEASKAGFAGYVPFLVVYDADGNVAFTGGYAPAAELKKQFQKAGIVD